MKNLPIAALLLACVGANAQVYQCPQRYPGKDAPGSHLSSAGMQIGERRGDGVLHGKEAPARAGTDTRYGFPVEGPRWLICLYGGRERIKGDVINGHEWVVALRWVYVQCCVSHCEGYAP